MLEMLILALLPTGGDVWNFMAGVGEGEVFEYYICDPNFLDSYSNQHDICYWAEIKFHPKFTVRNDTVHAMYVKTSVDTMGLGIKADAERAVERLMITNVDKRLVSHVPILTGNNLPVWHSDRDYADSLESTLFWNNGWTGASRFFPGESVGRVDKHDASTALRVTTIERSTTGSTEYTAEYTDYLRSFVRFNTGLPIPTEAEIYTKSHGEDFNNLLFSFRLVAYAEPGMDLVKQDEIQEIDNDYFEIGDQGGTSR